MKKNWSDELGKANCCSFRHPRLLRPEVVEAIAGCDAIIHGGDINKPEITERLQEIAPDLCGVGATTTRSGAEHIPATLTFQIEDCRFFLVHNKKEVPKDLTGIDAVIFGHSHRYFEQVIDGRLWLNSAAAASAASIRRLRWRF